MDLPKHIFEQESEKSFFSSKKNIVSLLVVGILVLAVPFGVRLSQTQQQLQSKASSVACIAGEPGPFDADHAPLQDIAYYRVIEDSDEGACECPSPDDQGNCQVSKVKPGKDAQCSSRPNCDYMGSQRCGFFWTPSHGRLHLQFYSADKVSGCREGDLSFCSDAYNSVINHPRFTEAVAAIDGVFRLDQVWYKNAVNVPGLGRGDDRFFDPAFRVVVFLNATSGSFFSQLNPNKIHDPVEYLYDRGFWERPSSGPDATRKSGVANPAPVGRGVNEEYFGHWTNTLNRGGFKEMDGNKSLVDLVKQQNRRGKVWNPPQCGSGIIPVASSDPSITRYVASCSDGKIAFQWPITQGASKYLLRIDDSANGWGGGASIQPGDSIVDNVSSNNYTHSSASANHAYYWWIHPVDGRGVAGDASEKQFVVCSPSSGTVCAQVVTGARNNISQACNSFANSCIPEGWTRDDACLDSGGNTGEVAAPSELNVSCNDSGTQATLSWSAVSGAGSYQHQIDKNPPSWRPESSGSGDQKPISPSGETSRVVNVASDAPYEWTVQAVPPGKTSQSYGATKSRTSVNFTCSSGGSSGTSCDFNSNGSFDEGDYTVWYKEFTKQVFNSPWKSDCNGDGKVDLIDFNKWRNRVMDGGT